MGPWDMRWTGWTYLCYVVVSFLLVSCILLVGHSFVLCTLSSFTKIDKFRFEYHSGIPLLCFIRMGSYVLYISD
jgi:hypothetical protein